MKGRKPIPSEILILNKGTLYGEQKKRTENKPVSNGTAEPVCPHYFRPSEREAWEYLSEILKNYSLYIDINAPLLEIAAVYLAEFRNSQWELIRVGKIIRAKDNKKRNPSIGDRNKSAELLMKALIELNISACGVARLGAAVGQGKNKKKAEFFED